MKNFTFKLMAAFIAITAIAAVSGCTSTTNDIDLSVDNDVISEEENSTVDIRQDKETTASTAESEPEEVIESEVTEEETPAAATTAEEPDDPVVIITTDAVVTTTTSYSQTIRTDLPPVTAEPQYTTTSSTTTSQAAQTEPVEIETDSNGFPANPRKGDKFTDSTGQEYIYDNLFDQWVPGNSGNVNLQEFPDFELSGDKILS